ncbi:MULTISPECIES: YceI family protein [Sphingomonas]|jgi:polyisoprenoid-binding protein YceI|uniref:YceI family protein n=2 Tax=Pseudomonadota TaxID=1224 RepID=A0ABU4PK64_9SPHN|nr:YceI family protein [Sphingomonas echinoides]MDX5984481.1 YceI family protein [Sphingomonas echinoides]
MRLTHLYTATAAVLLFGAPVVAQMAPPEMLRGAGTVTDVKAGTYAVEPHHTQVTFSVSHFGISPYAGTFSDASGTLKLDPAKPAETQLDVTLPIASVQTTSSVLTGELKSADWFDAAKFPTATFHSTKVTQISGDAVAVDGTLTLHGVTKPVTFRAKLFGAATNPMSKKASIGFLGRMVIHRSDFGVSKYVPVVSDETVLVINAAFELQ